MTTEARTAAALATECIPNIGPAERRKRLRFGFLLLGIGVVLAAVLLSTGAARAWRLVVLLPLWSAAVGFVQVRDKTCVRLAAQNQRNMDDGPQTITDPAELAQVRRQARRVHIQSFVLAAAATALVLMLPGGH
jgi:hypothetical protein